MTKTLNHQFATQILKENFKNNEGCETLREYTKYCAENDPTFFGWLFGSESEISDYGQGMTEEQREEYNNFLNTL